MESRALFNYPSPKFLEEKDSGCSVSSSVCEDLMVPPDLEQMESRIKESYFEKSSSTESLLLDRSNFSKSSPATLTCSILMKAGPRTGEYCGKPLSVNEHRCTYHRRQALSKK